jgi:hypothetical protein
LLTPGERVASNSNTPKLYQYHLNNESEEHDCYKEPIVEKILEYIELLAKFAAIDLVENLH